MYNEYKFRELIPLTHEQYLDEPTETVDWFPRFAELDTKLQQQAQERAAKETQG